MKQSVVAAAGLCLGLFAARAEAPFPRISMLWSPAEGAGKLVDKMARYHVAVVGPEDVGLEWTKERFPAMAEKITAESAAEAREFLDALHTKNPETVVLIETYFFEANDRDYPAGSPWWFRDATGKKIQFWRGCHTMDVGNTNYSEHIARRIAAIHGAVGNRAGIYLDNLRFDPLSRRGWSNLLTSVRADWDDVPILVNAGWDSDDLDWIAPMINGIMYEDSVAHTGDRDEEKFYARIAGFDALLRAPRVSVNEKFGKRTDAAMMLRELARTLVYTDMAFLFSDSTQEHAHSWQPLWNPKLGKALDAAVNPSDAVAVRHFEHGIAAWLPKKAKAAARIEFGRELQLPNGGRAREVALRPGEGLVAVEMNNRKSTENKR